MGMDAQSCKVRAQGRRVILMSPDSENRAVNVHIANESHEESPPVYRGV